MEGILHHHSIHMYPLQICHSGSPYPLPRCAEESVLKSNVLDSKVVHWRQCQVQKPMWLDFVVDVFSRKRVGLNEIWGWFGT